MKLGTTCKKMESQGRKHKLLGYGPGRHLVTMAAVCMGVKEMGMRTGQRGDKWPPSQD